MEMEEGVAIRDKERERDEIFIWKLGCGICCQPGKLFFPNYGIMEILGGIDVGLGERFS